MTSYIAGYQAGGKAADPSLKFLNAFSDDFADQAKCETLANQQIQQGSKIVFQVAGGCGLGALQAAKQKGDYGIGVDADQGYLGSYILTSALKKVDVAVEAGDCSDLKGHFDARWRHRQLGHDRWYRLRRARRDGEAVRGQARQGPRRDQERQDQGSGNPQVEAGTDHRAQ